MRAIKDKDMCRSIRRLDPADLSFAPSNYSNSRVSRLLGRVVLARFHLIEPQSLGTNLKIDFVFVIVAEVNDVVAAVAGAPFTAQALGMDRKQN